MSESKAKSTLSHFNGRTALKRDAHIVTRFPLGTGNLSVGASGTVTTGGVGGFNTNGTGSYLLRPTEMGWIADLASHFALWKLHRLTLMFTPTRRIVTTFADLTAGSTVGTGVVVVGFNDDISRPTAATAAVIQELRSSGEFDLGRPWSLSFKPTGIAAGWLYCSKESTSDPRLVEAAQLCMVSSAATAANLTVGRLELIVDISMKGAAPFSTPLLDRPLIGAVEEQKSSPPSRGAGAPTGAQAGSRGDGGDEYELVQIPLRRVPLLKEKLGLA